MLARRNHETLWLGSRFLDAALRTRIEALLALDGELLRISSAVTEPTMGQIRFQWWMDQLDGYDADRSKVLGGDAFLIALAFDDADANLFEMARQWMESREKQFLGEIGPRAGSEPLFRLLNGLVGKEGSATELSLYQASVYSLLDGEELTSDALIGLANALDGIKDEYWPIASVFATTGDWVQGKIRSPLGRRLLVLKSFLQGEAALANRLCKLASELSL